MTTPKSRETANDTGKTDEKNGPATVTAAQTTMSSNEKAAANKAGKKNSAPASATSKTAETEAESGGKAAPSEKSGGLRITAKREGGIRRAGLRHPSEATDHPQGTFTAKQIEQLKADPDLVVVEI